MPNKYIYFLPNICVRKPKLIMPIADEIEKTVITQTVTDLVVEKLLSIWFNDRAIIPISIVKRLVAKQIKIRLIIFLFNFKVFLIFFLRYYISYYAVNLFSWRMLLVY